MFDSLQAVKYYLQTKQTQLRETGKVVANDEKFR
jgi:hypothetical protein